MVVGVVPIVFRDKSVRAVLEVIALFYSKYVLKYSSKRGCNLRETLPKVMLWTLDLCVTVPAPPREGFFFLPATSVCILNRMPMSTTVFTIQSGYTNATENRISGNSYCPEY